MLYDKINYGTPFYRSRWRSPGTSTFSELPINRDATDLPSFCIVSFALHISQRTNVLFNQLRSNSQRSACNFVQASYKLCSWFSLSSFAACKLPAQRDNLKSYAKYKNLLSAPARSSFTRSVWSSRKIENVAVQIISTSPRCGLQYRGYSK